MKFTEHRVTPLLKHLNNIIKLFNTSKSVLSDQNIFLPSLNYLKKMALHCNSQWNSSPFIASRMESKARSIFFQNIVGNIHSIYTALSHCCRRLIFMFNNTMLWYLVLLYYFNNITPLLSLLFHVTDYSKFCKIWYHYYDQIFQIWPSAGT